MIYARNIHKATSALGTVAMLFALAAFSSAACAQAGYVHHISGSVSIRSAAEKSGRFAKAGDKFESNTFISTGADGKLVLKFADGLIVAVGADSSLRIGPYRYDAASLRQSVSTLELVKGQMRIVTGLIGAANRESMRIIAGESTIRIEKPGGTDFTVAVNPDPQETGYAVVARGEISVRTPYGPITLLTDNQYAPWRPGRAPPLPLPIAAAPAAVQAATAGLWASVLPSNTPVVVTSAAQLAVAAATPSTLPAQQAAAAPAARLAGFIAEITNGVSIKSPSGGAAAAKVGTTFDAGATVNTGAEARAVLKFADGQVVVLGPSSTLAVGDYKFDPSNVKSSSSSLDLVNGAMRVITGTIQAENPAGISITAGASIIDILNTGLTDFTVAVDVKNLEVGVARVTVGELAVHTPYGPIDKIPTDKSNMWGPHTTRDSPMPVAAALGVVQAAVAVQLSGLPDNAPVAVALAASAAAQVAQAAQAQAAANANPQNAQLQAAAQAATELANLASRAAAAASEAVVAKVIATTLDTLPPTAAGPALAQAPAQGQATPAFPTALPPAPVPATVTPGTGGGCLGSPC